MKPVTETRQFDDRGGKETNRKKPKSTLLMMTFWMGMAVAVSGQDTRHLRMWPHYSAEQGSRVIVIRDFGKLPLDELARRIGIEEAVAISFQLQREEEARREMKKIKAAQQQDLELRKKVVELVNTSYKLHERLNDPSVIHADTPELAKRCEKLAKAIKKLLP
ncbi:hypothetical protein MYX82_00520 [Acidobacteria bacterium AH-259-D05]|nr:hypothetical protein [Acidobacteria bacterium AH-259-D05]